MEGQRALADAALALAHRDEVTHPREPVSNTGVLFDDLFKDSGPAVADDVVIALHRGSILPLLPRSVKPG